MAVYVTDPFRRNVITGLVLAALLIVGLLGLAVLAAVFNFIYPAEGAPARWARWVMSALALDLGSIFAFIVPVAAAIVPVAINAVSYRFTVTTAPAGAAAQTVSRTSELSNPGKAVALILLIGGVLNAAAILVLNQTRDAISILVPSSQIESVSTVLMVSLSFQAAYFVQLMGLRPEG